MLNILKKRKEMDVSKAEEKSFEAPKHISLIKINSLKKLLKQVLFSKGNIKINQ